MPPSPTHPNRLFKRLLFCLLFLASTFNASAQYWGGKADVSAAEMAFHDVCIEKYSPTTYYAFWQNYLLNKRTGGDVIYFYGGSDFNNQNIEDFHYSTNHVWTFWHMPVRPLYARDGYTSSFSVGEGASSRIGGPYKLHEGRWYRQVMRMWSPSDKDDAEKTTYIGWWMKDLDGDGEWKTIGICSIPLPDVRFKGPGIAGFIEQFGGQSPTITTQSFRNFYSRMDGKWFPVKPQIQNYPNAHQRFTYNPKDKSVKYDISGKPMEGSSVPAKPTIIDLKQDPTPPMGSPEIGSISATRYQSNLVVEWATTAKSTPQLRYKVELLDAAGATVTSRINDLPHVNSLFIELSDAQAKRVSEIKISLTDIFDQTTGKTAPITQLSADGLLAPASAFENSAPGFKIDFYELQEAKPTPTPKEAFANWNQLPSLENEDLVRTRTAFQKELNLVLTPREYGTVTKISSFLTIPTTGLYRFHLKACDGGKLMIGGKEVVAQSHFKSTNPKVGWVLLEKGKHAVEMLTFRDNPGRNYHQVALSYEGPDTPLTEVPESAWSIPLEWLPSEKLDLVASVGKGKRSNYVTFKVDNFLGDKANLEKITLTNKEGETWASFDINNSTTTDPIFMPEAEHTFFPRLFLKGGIVINLKPTSFTTKNPPSKQWTANEPEPRARRPFGFMHDGQKIILMGDTSRAVSREVKGDFVFEMRVKEFTNSVGPWAKTAYAGFGLQVTNQSGSAVFNWSYTPYYQGRYETPKNSHGGLHQENWGKSLHYLTFPCHFRFSRKGDTIKAEYRNKDEKWVTLTEEKQANLEDTLRIAPSIYQSPEPNPKVFFRVEFDQIKLEKR